MLSINPENMRKVLCIQTCQQLNSIIAKRFAIEYIPYTTTLVLLPQHLVKHACSTQHRPVGCPRHRFECMSLAIHETDPIMGTRMDCFSRYVELQVHLKKGFSE
jgi:hypothetical protein